MFCSVSYRHVTTIISRLWRYHTIESMVISRSCSCAVRWRAAGERGKTSLRWTTRSWVEACATTTTRTSSTRLQGNATCTASSATCRTCWDTRWRSCMACWECSRTPRTEAAAAGNPASRPDLGEGLCLAERPVRSARGSSVSRALNTL